ncbi:MAG: hypothetical protein RL662_293 [Bacteroidota bacterium]
MINNNVNMVEANTSVWSKFGVSGEVLLNRKVESIPCIIEPLFQKVGLACIAGSSDTGKSSFLRNLCMNVVAGRKDFLGFSINAIHRRAIYTASEDDENAINFLIHKQNLDMEIEPSTLKELVFVFDTENLLDKLDRMMTEKPVDLVCIDAFGDLYDGSMNDSAQVRTFLNQYFLLAQKHQCLILFLHHCGKRTEDGTPNKNNLLGSQGFEAKMRIVMELRNDKVEANMKHLCIVKGNYLPQDTKNESFKLKFTENMVYENTGERIAFENLKKTDNDEKEKFKKAKELYEQGQLTLEKIAPLIGLSNKGNVSRLFTKFGYKPERKTKDK